MWCRISGCHQESDDQTQIVDLKRWRSLELALVTTKRVLHDKVSPNAIWMVGSYYSWRLWWFYSPTNGTSWWYMYLFDHIQWYSIMVTPSNQPIALRFWWFGFSGLDWIRRFLVYPLRYTTGRMYIQYVYIDVSQYFPNWINFQSI